MEAGHQVGQLAAFLFVEQLVGEALLELLQAGCGVFGGVRGCARLRCVHSPPLGMWAGSREMGGLRGAICVVNDRILAVYL